MLSIQNCLEYIIVKINLEWPQTFFSLFSQKIMFSVCLPSCQIAYLGAIGGCDIQTATRRIMATLIGHSLATKLNWNGSHEKRAFQSLKLKRVVTGKSNSVTDQIDHFHPQARTQAFPFVMYKTMTFNKWGKK